MPPSGTAISAIAPAMTSEFLSASQKSLSAKMNSNAPTPKLVRREERRVEQALVEDQPERQEDGERRQADDAAAAAPGDRRRHAIYLPALIAACHCLMKSSRLVWSR